MSRLRLIDAPEFARFGRVLEGQVPLAEFGRLQSWLSDAAGKLQYRIGGTVDQQGYPSLLLDLQARLLVTCQRCLQELELPVKVHNRIAWSNRRGPRCRGRLTRPLPTMRISLPRPVRWTCWR